MIEPVPSSPTPAPIIPQRMSVSIKDIDMPFWSMVVFMIKWAIASIPAGIILLVVMLIIGAIFWGVVTVFCGGLIAGLSGLQ